MTVDLIDWKISWTIEGVAYKALNMPQEMKECQLHPTIIFPDADQ